MPKPTKGPRLGGSPTHERLILRNLASQLFEHGRITTTETKARRVQPLAEKLITKAKRGDLHSRRLVLQSVTDVDVVHKLFTDIAPRLADRDGGCTRITKIGPRKGDNAPMAIIEIVGESVEESRSTKAKAPRAAARTDKPAAGSTRHSSAPAASQTGIDEAAADHLSPEQVPADVPEVVATEAAVVEEDVATEAAAAEGIAAEVREPETPEAAEEDKA